VSGFSVAGHGFSYRRLLSGLAISLAMLILRGPSLYTLAWSCLVLGLSCSERSSDAARLPWLLAAFSALMGNGAGGMVCLLSACVLELNLHDDIRRRIVPFVSLMLLAGGGELTGLTFLLLGCGITLVLDRRILRYVACSAFIFAGILILGPPTSRSSEQLQAEYIPLRWPAYDWHDTILVTRSHPNFNQYYQSSDEGMINLHVTSSFSSEDGSGGWIQQGDTYYPLTTGSNRISLRSWDPFQVVLSGEWRPFSPDRIGIRIR